MATKSRRKIPEQPEHGPPKGDFQALSDHARTHPMLYTAAIAFIVLCGFAGVVYRVYASNQTKEIGAAYARALDIVDPAERQQALSEAAKKDSTLKAEILYMQGEAAFGAKDFESATLAFERIQLEFPSSSFAPDAVEGLGFIEEENKNYEAALERFMEVDAKWSNTFAGHRQQNNIGRCQERLGNIEGAVVAYREQLEIFPGSFEEQRANDALDRLRKSHPGLFPDAALAEAPERSPEEEAESPSEVPPVTIKLDEIEALPTDGDSAAGETAGSDTPADDDPES